MTPTKRDRAAMALAIADDPKDIAWSRTEHMRNALELGGPICARLLGEMRWDSGGWNDGAGDKQIPHANEVRRRMTAQIRGLLR